MYRRLSCLKVHVTYSCTPTDSASHFLIGERVREREKVLGQDTRSGADVILHKKSSILPAISAVMTSKLRARRHPIRTFFSKEELGWQVCRTDVHAEKEWK